MLRSLVARFRVTTTRRDVLFRERLRPERAFPHLGKRNIALRKGAFCLSVLTRKHSLTWRFTDALYEGMKARAAREVLPPSHWRWDPRSVSHHARYMGCVH